MPDNAAFPSSSSSFVLVAVAVAAAGAAAVCYVCVGPSVAVVAVEALMLSEKANLPGYRVWQRTQQQPCREELLSH